MSSRHFELPAKPSPEYYRKQAKQLHRAFHAGDTDAVARASDVLGNGTSARFLLSDAQFVLAQEHGFRSWADFRANVESRTEPARPVSRIGRYDEAEYDAQARALLSELRAGDPKALHRLEAYVPRFAESDDAPDVQLSDARLVIAGEFGFPTWRELLFYNEKYRHEYAELKAEWRRLTPHLEALRAGDTDRLGELAFAQADQLLHLLTQPDAFEDVRLGKALGVPRAGVDILLAKATDLDFPLGLAACFNRVEYLQILLEAGARVDRTDGSGMTPLVTAIYHGSAESADILADYGVIPMALWTAAACGRLDLVQSCFDVNGRLRPESAVHRPNPSDIGMEPRPPETTDPDEIIAEAFVHACQNGRLDVVRWFLDQGVDPDTAPYYGRTGLHWAIAHSRIEIVRLLLERGANPAIRDDIHGGDADGWAHYFMEQRPNDTQTQQIHDVIESAEHRVRHRDRPSAQ